MPPNTPQPGRAGQSFGRQRGPRRQQSRYAVQLEEKQNLKKTFGVRERQLKGYYREAQRSREETGPLLVQLMERRLDNALYRAGFAVNRTQARQIAGHRMMEVNGRPVDVPSLRLNVGDVVRVKENKRKKSYFTNFAKRMQNVSLPSWLELDIKNFAFKVVAAPTSKEAKLGVDIQSIVELLSR
ncbi:MAG: 30S ribosomal protein S4 [bacterium]